VPVRLSIVTVALALLTAGASAATWSQPATLHSCAPARDPEVVFPFSEPSQRSGRGAILWLGSQPGCSLDGALTLDGATLHTSDRPSIARSMLAPGRVSAPLAAAGTTAGQLVAVLRERSGTTLAEGAAGAPLSRVATIGAPGSAFAAADGYIGDADVVSVASVDGRQALVLREQRHYERSFAAAVTMLEGPAPISSLAVALDFRADSLVVWAQSGEVRSQWISNAGSVSPPQVLGPAGYAPQIAAVLSDDNRAFVLWSDQPPVGSSAQTTIYLDHSGENVTFAAPARVIATLGQPPAQRLGRGAVALVRQTPSEGVIALWPIILDGDYALQAAGLTSATVLAPATISQIGADLRLAAIATGPHNDVVVALERAPRAPSGGFDQTQQAILAARTIPGGPGGVAFETPVLLAPEGPNSAPAVAVDPNSDRAVLAWQTVIGGSDQIAYAVRGAP